MLQWHLFTSTAACTTSVGRMLPHPHLCMKKLQILKYSQWCYDGLRCRNSPIYSSCEGYSTILASCWCRWRVQHLRQPAWFGSLCMEVLLLLRRVDCCPICSRLDLLHRDQGTEFGRRSIAF